MVSEASPFHFICSTFGPPPILEAHYVLPEGKSLLTPTSSPVMSLLNHRLYLIPALSYGLTLTSGILHLVIQKNCVCSLRCKYLPIPTPLQVPLDLFSSHSWEHLLFQLINEYNVFAFQAKQAKDFKLHGNFKSGLDVNTDILPALTQCLKKCSSSLCGSACGKLLWCARQS